MGAWLSAPVPCPRKHFLPELWLAGADGALQSSSEPAVQWLFGFLQNKTAFSSLASPRDLTGEKAAPSSALLWVQGTLQFPRHQACLPLALQTRSSPCPSW